MLRRYHTTIMVLISECYSSQILCHGLVSDNPCLGSFIYDETDRSVNKIQVLHLCDGSSVSKNLARNQDGGRRRIQLLGQWIPSLLKNALNVKLRIQSYTSKDGCVYPNHVLHSGRYSLFVRAYLDRQQGPNRINLPPILPRTDLAFDFSSLTNPPTRFTASPRRG